MMTNGWNGKNQDFRLILLFPTLVRVNRKITFLSFHEFH